VATEKEDLAGPIPRSRLSEASTAVLHVSLQDGGCESPWRATADPCSRTSSLGISEGHDQEGGDEGGGVDPSLVRLHALALKEGWLMQKEEVDFSQARMVGLGSVGQVYRARLCLTNEQVAVKAVRDDLTAEQRIQNRSVEDLVQEVNMLSSVGLHPRIVRFIGCILDPTEAAASPTIVEEFLGGTS